MPPLRYQKEAHTCPASRRSLACPRDVHRLSFRRHKCDQNRCRMTYSLHAATRWRYASRVQPRRESLRAAAYIQLAQLRHRVLRTPRPSSQHLPWSVRASSAVDEHEQRRRLLLSGDRKNVKSLGFPWAVLHVEDAAHVAFERAASDA